MFPRRVRFTFALYVVLAVAFLMVSLLWYLDVSTPLHAQSQPDALGSISGFVRNAQGEPLPNIAVILEQYADDPSYPIFTTSSDATGSYEFAAVFPGIYRVRFSDLSGFYADSYHEDADSPDKATAVTVGGNAIENVDGKLSAPGSSLSITVQAGNLITGTKLELTLYRLSNTGNWQKFRTILQTAPFASVQQVVGLPFASYRLCARIFPLYNVPYSLCHEDNIPDPSTSLLRGAKDIVINSAEQQAITLDFIKNSQIHGQILAPTGDPLPGIKMRILNIEDPYYFIIETATDAEGRFSFNTLNGRFWLLANAQNNVNDGSVGEQFASMYYPESFNSDTAEIISVDSTTRISVTMKLREVGRITGTVTLSDGTPLPSPQVILYRMSEDGSWRNTCNFYYGTTCPYATYDPATAIYTATHVAPGTYRLGAEQYFNFARQMIAGYHGGTQIYNARNVTVKSGKTTPNVNIVLATSGFNGMITGTVTADGIPQAGIVVGLLPEYPAGTLDLPYLTAMTDVQGHYQLGGLTVGYYRVSAKDPQGRFATQNYRGEPWPSPFFVSGIHPTPDIDFSLIPGGGLRGRILTPAGESPENYRLYAYRTLGSPEYYFPVGYLDVLSDHTGFFEIKGLAPDNYYISARPPETSNFPAWLERFYPGTNDQYTAQPVTVQAGQLTEGVDIRIQELSNLSMPYIGTGTVPVE